MEEEEEGVGGGGGGGGPSICMARRYEYTSYALSSLKLSREAVQVTAHSLHTQAPCSDPTTGHRQRQPAVSLHLP